MNPGFWLMVALVSLALQQWSFMAFAMVMLLVGLGVKVNKAGWFL